MEKAPPLDLAPLSLAGLTPVIRVIHRYPVCRPLGYLVEAAWGRGGIVICALQLDEQWLEASYLRAQMLAHMAGPRWEPAEQLAPAALQSLCAATSLP